MIGKLKGTVDYFGVGYLVIDVNGVGYKVSCNEITIGKASSSETIELFIYTHVKEDQLDLIGFETQDELELFELLISVSGIGPKAALNILNIASPDVVKTAIVNRDPTILTQVSGIGKKIAERVILELQNKVKNFSAVVQQTAQGDQDVIEALVSMGYNISEAREAAKNVQDQSTDVSERIKLALRSMKK
jgi:Holliday junction DNA helicase RuvA